MTDFIVFILPALNQCVRLSFQVLLVCVWNFCFLKQRGTHEQTDKVTDRLMFLVSERRMFPSQKSMKLDYGNKDLERSFVYGQKHNSWIK